MDSSSLKERVAFHTLSSSVFLSAYFGNLKELFKDTILLNTIFSGVESFASTQ